MAKKRATVSLRKPSPAPEVEAPEKPAAAVEGAVSVVAMASSEPEPVTAAPVAPVMPAAPEVMSIETLSAARRRRWSERSATCRKPSCWS